VFFSHFRLQSQSEGNKIESMTMMKITHWFVFPNCDMPKNVATVLGKDVIVVIIVKYSVTSVNALIEKFILLLTVDKYAFMESDKISR
jgi:hypothetical protein